MVAMYDVSDPDDGVPVYGGETARGIIITSAQVTCQYSGFFLLLKLKPSHPYYHVHIKTEKRSKVKTVARRYRNVKYREMNRN